MTDFAQDILRLALRKNLKLATAESCTGGLIAAALTELAGSSGAFERGFVTYSNAAKIEMLGINPSTLEQFGAVSPEVALEMARVHYADLRPMSRCRSQASPVRAGHNSNQRGGSALASPHDKPAITPKPLNLARLGAGKSDRRP